MQVVENWAQVSGTVRDVSAHPTLAAYAVVNLDVESVADIAGYPNLFREAAGQTLAVSVPREGAVALGIAPASRRR